MKVINKDSYIAKQYNADIINFSGQSSPSDFACKLEQLLAHITQAEQQDELGKEASQEAKVAVGKAVKKCREKDFDPTVVTRYLKTARDWVSGVDGLVEAATAAITAISRVI